MNTVERYRKRKKKLQQLSNNHNYLDQNTIDLSKVTSSDIDYAFLKKHEEISKDQYVMDCDLEVSESEIQSLLQILEKEFNDKRFNDLVNSCKRDVMSAIVTPFGLGGIVSKFDKNGGNVTTLNNFKEGVTANSEDTQRYREWENSKTKLDRTPYDKDIKFDRNGNPTLNKNGEVIKTDFNSNKKREMYQKMTEGDMIHDGYTGKPLGEKQNNQINKNTTAGIDLEHITPVKKIETDAKNHLFAEGNDAEKRQKDRVDLSRDDHNLTITDSSVNRSKGSKDLMEWAKQNNRNDPTKTNAEYYNANMELMEKEYKKSNDFIKKEQLKKQIKKQGKETLVTGAKEGIKMGTQQALGLILCEFFNAIFDEIHDIYKSGFNDGFEDQSFFLVLKKRFGRIGEKVISKWKDSVEAFTIGFISGFISNLVTVIINMFVRTGKRIVRVIREGFFSLLKAVKMLCFPPKGMTFSQAAHEASKLIASGLALTGGIFLEQYIDSLIKATPFLEPIADIITTVIIGGITGLSITFIVFAIDKIDLFKVNYNENQKQITKKIEAEIEVLFEKGNSIVTELNLASS